jgi:hypothetical protein
MPDADPMEAIAVLVLIHVPPAEISESVVELPTHISAPPAIGAGMMCTLTIVVALHPVAST